MGPTTIQGVHLRTEDGALYVPTTNNVQLITWRYIRLEDGTDFLWGPQGLVNDGPVAELRMGPGDVGVLERGHAT